MILYIYIYVAADQLLDSSWSKDLYWARNRGSMSLSAGAALSLGSCIESNYIISIEMIIDVYFNRRIQSLRFFFFGAQHPHGKKTATLTLSR